MVVAQPVSAPLTRAAIFLVVMINPGPENRAAVRSLCADVAGLIRAVEFRDLEAGLSCVIGIGSDAWDRLFGKPRPAELHPFREVRAGPRHAVSTPGDLMFHIRAKRMDLCFEMAVQIMARLAGAVTAIDDGGGRGGQTAREPLAAWAGIVGEPRMSAFGTKRTLRKPQRMSASDP